MTNDIYNGKLSHFISLENLKTLLFEKGNLNRNINEITNSLWGFGGVFFFSILFKIC